MSRGQETVGPGNRTTCGDAAGVGNDDVGRQFVGLASHAVAKPGAASGESVEAKAGVLLECRGRMV